MFAQTPSRSFGKNFVKRGQYKAYKIADVSDEESGDEDSVS